MLKLTVWANSLAATAVIFYLILWVLGAVSPTLFQLVFNAQFLGADVASLYSGGQDINEVIITLIVIGLSSWAVGYIWAILYNNWSKKR